MNEDTISIIYFQNEDNDFNSKGLISSRTKESLHRVCKSVSVTDFSNSLASAIQVISNSITSVESSLNSYELDEIEFNLEISAEGTISLIGSVGVGTTGGITLKFKKNNKNE